MASSSALPPQFPVPHPLGTTPFICRSLHHRAPAGTIFWTLGTTPLLVSSLTTLILLFLSDALLIRNPDKGWGRSSKRKAGSNHGGTDNEGLAPPPVSRSCLLVAPMRCAAAACSLP